MRVAVLTTGKAELIGLHLALKRLFPEHEFLPVPGRQRDTPFNGVTSTRITQDSPVSRSTTAMKLIQSAAAALEDLAWLMKDPGNKRCSRYSETMDVSAPLPWLNESTQPALTEYVWPGKVLRNI